MANRTFVTSGTTWESIAGYARAVRVGAHIAVAGTTAVDGDGKLVGGADPGAQARFIFDKIEKALQQLGGEMRHVVRTRMYVSDARHWEPVVRAHGERFKDIKPVATLVEAKLIGPEYLVEIEVDAIMED
jgi:enamine deaminase RidA (YjgF/YER057c/UK114 family)